MNDDEFFPNWCKIYRGRQGNCFVSLFGEPTPILLENHLVSLFQYIRGCKSLDMHAKTIIGDSGGYINRAEAERIVSLLIDRNLLKNKSKWLKAISKLDKMQSNQLNNTTIKICWVTHNAVTALERSIKSILSKLPSDTELSIFNDNSDQKVEDTYRNYIEKINRYAQNKIKFIGVAEKECYLKKLKSDHNIDNVSDKLLRFCIYGQSEWSTTVGANRNSMLLFSAGNTILSNDEDIYLPYADLSPKIFGMTTSQHNTIDSLCLSSDPDPALFRFFNTYEEIEKHVPIYKESIVDCHTHYLGRLIPECIDNVLDKSGFIELESADSVFLNSITRNQIRIRMTCCGIMGDPGLGNPRYYLLHDGIERSQLVKSKKEYERFITNRISLIGASRPTITESYTLRGAHLGLDNSSLLPPFIPVGRGEDFIFALLLSMCFNPGSIIHLPLAVTHKPLIPRLFKKNDLLKIDNRMSDVLHLLLSAIEQWEIITDPSGRMKYIGECLFQIGSSSLSSFEDFVYSLWIEKASRDITMYEQLLNKYNSKPHFWAKDIERIIKAYERYTLSNVNIIPSDFIGVEQYAYEGKTKQARIACRNVVKLFGELLIHWPDIWQSAKKLNDSGYYKD